MSPRTRKRVALTLEIGTPVALLLLWGIWSADSGSLYYPPLTEILVTFRETWIFERFGSDVVPSLARMLSGWAIAIVLGVGGGLALGLLPRVRRAVGPLIEFLRAVPPPVLIPVAMLVLGVGAGMKVAVIAFVCLWPILLNTIDGTTAVEPVRRETARMYGVRGIAAIRWVVLPSAGPQIFAGLRTSLSVALILMVVSEMVASTNGIGYFVLSSQRTFALTEMWAGILLLGLLGYALNMALGLVERAVLGWYRGSRAMARDAS